MAHDSSQFFDTRYRAVVANVKTGLRIYDETPDPEITYRPLELSNKIWKYPSLTCPDCEKVYKKRGWLKRHRRLKHFLVHYGLISLMGVGASKFDRLAGLGWTA